jgi:hypothetical protein
MAVLGCDRRRIRFLRIGESLDWLSSLRGGLLGRVSAPRVAIVTGIVWLILSAATFSGLIYLFRAAEYEYGMG